jgi:hypothetical protein
MWKGRERVGKSERRGGMGVGGMRQGLEMDVVTMRMRIKKAYMYTKRDEKGGKVE